MTQTMKKPSDIPIREIARQHPQTRDIKCVYHGTKCLVASDGEIVCRIFGNVIRRIEDAGTYGYEAREYASQSAARGVQEPLGTIDPVLNRRSNKIHTRRRADAVWHQRIRKLADQFGIKKSVRNEIEFVFSLLRRKTAHRPSLVLYFAFYNTCREHGAAAISEKELCEAICHCCNLKTMYSILKVYGIFAIEAQKLGVYKSNQTSGFYFNSFLRMASETLGLDEIDRNYLERSARKKYMSLPSSMGEKTRTMNTFMSVLGIRGFEALRRKVRY